MTNYQVSEADKLVAELCKPLPPARAFFDSGMSAIAFFLTIVAMIPLVSILKEIIFRGVGSLRPEMFFTPVIENGFANAIVGTITVVAIGSIFSIPIGIMTGVFLSEIGQGTAIGRVVRFIASILTGIPSIVVGIFTYGVIVVLFKLGFSALAGGFALAILMLPIVALTTEEALKLIPQSLRSGSAALGGTRFQTIYKVIFPAAISPIMTGVLLAVSRAAGETAPLIFTAFFSSDWSQINSPTASLPILIFQKYNDPSPENQALVWTASLVLVSMVLLISLASRIFTRKKKA
jgi:phosphate transport system permease protein